MNEPFLLSNFIDLQGIDNEITKMSNGLLNREILLNEALKAADFMYENGVIKENENSDNDNEYHNHYCLDHYHDKYHNNY